MGHGIAAAMLMATARGILRSRSCEPGSTGELLTHLNNLLVEVTQGVRFMTMIMATLDTDTRILRWAGAGHDPPFIFDPNSNQFIELDGGAFPLGIMPDHEYEEHVVGPLPEGAVLAIVTDGVFEARNEQGEMYGKERIKQIIIEHCQSSARDIADQLERDLTAFQGEAPQGDDITYVIARLCSEPNLVQR